MKLEMVEALRDAVSEVLEKQAFMMVEPEPGRGSAMAELGRRFVAEIRFSGWRAGSLCLGAGEKLCLALSGNILGLDTSHPDVVRLAPDALRETSNIICGMFLDRLPEGKSDFLLEPPRVHEANQVMWGELFNSADSSVFRADEHPLAVMVKFEAAP